MTKDEALRMALNGITKVPTFTHGLMVKLADVEAAIKAALAQPSDSVEHEPVAWIGDSPTRGNGKRLFWTKGEAYHYATTHYPLYTTPPQRTWVGLTDVEWEAMYDKFAKYQEYGAFASGWDKFTRAIEAKLKELNHEVD